MNPFDIYTLLNSNEQEVINDTIAEAICRAGYDLNEVDWDLTGINIK
jgi:hypothetical protein